MSKKEVSKEVKDVLGWIRTEIIAGGVLIPTSEAEKAWNSANERAVSILEKYKEGEGLFQL